MKRVRVAHTASWKRTPHVSVIIHNDELTDYTKGLKVYSVSMFIEHHTRHAIMFPPETYNLPCVSPLFPHAFFLNFTDPLHP